MCSSDLVERARSWTGLVGVDYVKEVTHKEPFQWDAKDQQSASFNLVRGNTSVDARTVRDSLPPADIPIVAYDFGMKYNILRRLRQHGFKVQVLPATTPAAEALKYKPAGIFLSNGPGDPAALGYAVTLPVEETGAGRERRVVRPARLELATSWFVARRSIQLS